MTAGSTTGAGEYAGAGAAVPDGAGRRSAAPKAGAGRKNTTPAATDAVAAVTTEPRPVRAPRAAPATV